MEKAIVPQQKYLSVIPEYVDGWIYCLATPCHSFEDYKKLPALITYNGEEYRLTGWHGERYEAYYKKDSHVQLAMFGGN